MDEADNNPDNPGLTEVLEAFLEYLHGVTRVGLPGKVVDYDRDTRTATIQPLVGRYLETQDGGERPEALPQLVGVPVEFPGAGQFELVWPLKPGATGMLHFADSSLDEWKDKANEAVIARDVRQHHLADATFRPGLRSPRAPGTAPRDDAMVLGILAGMSIHITEDGIFIGAADAPYKVALEAKVTQALSTLKAAIDGAVVIAQDGGANFKLTLMQALANWPPADIGSATVKVKG